MVPNQIKCPDCVNWAHLVTFKIANYRIDAPTRLCVLLLGRRCGKSVCPDRFVHPGSARSTGIQEIAPALGEFQNTAGLKIDEFTLILGNDYLI
jgi:hypothetical protein